MDSVQSQKPTTEPIVQHAALVRVGSSRIWDALTTASEWEAWFVGEMELEPRVGGRVRFHWHEWGPEAYTGDAPGEVTVFEPRTTFAFRWRSHPSHPETEVTFRLEQRGPITVVRLTETGFGDDVRAAMDNATGWGEALTLLKVYLEHQVRY